jgi:hypothetical protein
LIVWFEGLEVKSRLWDGRSWGEEQLVATNKSRPWRISVTALSGGNWAAAWFHRGDEGEEVFVKFFDGTKWHDQTKVSGDLPGYYPNIITLEEGGLAVIWEERVTAQDQYTLMVRSYDGNRWGDPVEVHRHRAASRYASLADHEDELYAIWFSGKSGDNEIYCARLRKR